MTRRGLDYCAFAPMARLLDLGCGPGASLALLKERGFAALGLDRSAALLAEARAHAPCLCADFTALPLADRSLDGILCECVLSLASDRESVLRECRRTLKKGALLLLSDLTRPAGGDYACATAAATCAAGALPLAAWQDLLRRSGFAVLRAEDHSPLLRELAARIVWTFGSLDCLLHEGLGAAAPETHAVPKADAGKELCPAGAAAARGSVAPQACSSGKKLGYALIIAQNKGEKT